MSANLPGGSAFGETVTGGPNDTGLAYEPGEERDDLVGEYLPVVEVGRVVGLGSRTDVALRVNSATFATARIKHQLVGTPTSLLAASAGLEGSINLGVALAGGSPTRTVRSPSTSRCTPGRGWPFTRSPATRS